MTAVTLTPAAPLAWLFPAGAGSRAFAQARPVAPAPPEWLALSLAAASLEASPEASGGSAAVSKTNDPDESLAALARAAQAGDPQSFRPLVEALTPALWGLARRLSDDAATADDLVQHTVVRLWQALPRLREPRAVRAFAFTTLRRVAADEVRSRRRRGRLTFSEGETEGSRAAAEAMPDAAPGADEQLAAAQTRGEVMRALESLDEDARLVLLLCDVDGVSYADAALALGVRPGTIASRLSRAREKLGRVLRARAAGRPEARRFPWPFGRRGG